jgi:acyl carrier protein
MNNSGAEMPITQQSILQFLCTEFDIDPTDFDGNTTLISSGIIDSLGVIHFVEFISKSAGIQVDASEVRLNNLDTMNLVQDFVVRKVGGLGGRAKTNNALSDVVAVN